MCYRKRQVRDPQLPIQGPQWLAPLEDSVKIHVDAVVCNFVYMEIEVLLLVFVEMQREFIPELRRSPLQTLPI